MTVAAIMSGCVVSNVAVEKLPINVARSPEKFPIVPVFDDTSRPRRDVIPFARIRVHGSVLATDAWLREQMAIRAASLGADCVWVADPRPNDTGSPVHADDLTFPTTEVKVVYGSACVYSPVRIGLLTNGQHLLEEVVSDSPAALAGLRRGDRLLAVGGRAVSMFPLALPEALAGAKPGDRITFEVAGLDHSVRTVAVVAAPNP